MSLFGEWFHITFKYLLEIISPVVGWCSIRTFANPCVLVISWIALWVPEAAAGRAMRSMVVTPSSEQTQLVKLDNLWNWMMTLEIVVPEKSCYHNVLPKQVRKSALAEFNGQFYRHFTAFGMFIMIVFAHHGFFIQSHFNNPIPDRCKNLPIGSLKINRSPPRFLGERTSVSTCFNPHAATSQNEKYHPLESSNILKSSV